MAEQCWLQTLVYLLHLFHSVSTTTSTSSSTASGESTLGLCCVSPQYAELGTSQYIHCDFPSQLSVVEWYTSKDDKYSTIYYKNSKVEGSGLDSSEFNISDDRSLVINNVSLRHEKTFRVDITINLTRTTFYINLTVTVQATQSNPAIYYTSCRPTGDTFSIASYISAKALTCSHTKARPALNISWYLRNKNTDIPLTSSFLSTPNGITFDSVANLELEDTSDILLRLFVCKSTGQAVNMKTVESEILIDSSQGSIANTYTIDVHLEIATTGKLKYDQAFQADLAIWKIYGRNDQEEGIIGHVFGETHVILNEPFRQFEIDENGFLILQNIDVRYEGTYKLIFSKDCVHHTVVFKVTVFIPPDPPYVSVDGCHGLGGCILYYSTNLSSFTCRVSGVYPDVTIDVETVGSSPIKITNTSLTSKMEFERYNTSLEVFYEYEETCTEKAVFLCKASGLAKDLFIPNIMIILIKGVIPFCEPIQYAQEGHKGYILCKFPSYYKDVTWTESLTDARTIPLISSHNGFQTGQCYKSGRDYDIFQNGSLIISRVERNGDRYFDVTLTDAMERTYCFEIVLIIIVPPTPPYITVDGCENSAPTECTLKGTEGSVICRLTDFYTEVPLSIKIVFGHASLQNVTASFKNENKLYSISLQADYVLLTNDDAVQLMCYVYAEKHVLISSSREINIKSYV